MGFRILELIEELAMNDSTAIRTFKYEDIGSKTISYLAEGLYPDARDPIREYVQNAVDAEAAEVAILISGRSIVIENNGNGMDVDDLSRSLQIAISDKDPVTNVGYKGIGIYSGLLIAEKLTIRSRKNNFCSQLTLNFEQMRELIDEELALPDVINQTTQLEAINTFDFADESLEGDGTQVELTGIRKEFIELFSKKQLPEYLTNALPLVFDPNFYYSNHINKKIRDICSETGYVYRSITLHLTIDGDRNTLYRPYKFDETRIFEPVYELIKLIENGKASTFALVWGCLNKQRRRISDKSIRGFRFRLKGFAIGNERTLLPYFSKNTTHAFRYIGEVVIFSHQIKSNTARSDLANTEILPQFREELKRVASNFELKSNVFQESSKALEECDAVERLLDEARKSPTSDSVSELKQRLGPLEKRLKQPLDEDSNNRVTQLIQKLKKQIPTLELILETSANGDSSEQNTNGGQSEDRDSSSTGTDEQTEVDSDRDDNKNTKQYGLPRNETVVRILDKLNSDGRRSKPQVRKLRQLYRSLRTISANQHPCLAYIGTWAMWEIVAKVHDGSSNRNSLNYLTDEAVKFCERMNEPNRKKDFINSLKHIHSEGNMNKHSDTAVAEASEMLINKMEVLDMFLLEMIKDIYKKFTGVKWEN